VSVGGETEDMTETTFRPVFTSSAVKRDSRDSRDNRDSRDRRDQGALDEASQQEREERLERLSWSEGKGASASRDSGLATSQGQNSQEIM
jgi:hypothetical protein